MGDISLPPRSPIPELQQVLSNLTGFSLGLPPELLIQIISEISNEESSQSSLHACTLVSRRWYSSAIMFLYEAPDLNNGNIQKFLHVICPSSSSDRRNDGLSQMIKRLDLSTVMDELSKSAMARLLGRVKHNLELLIAPPKSFAVNSMAALSRCHKLRHLDLSGVVLSLRKKEFAHILSCLPNLEILHFSASGGPFQRFEGFQWPQQLRELQITAPLYGPESFDALTQLPVSVTKLDLELRRPRITAPFIGMLRQLGPQLRSLRIHNGFAKSSSNQLDGILLLLPVIQQLCISICYIGRKFLDHAMELAPSGPSPLVELGLSCPESWIPGCEITSDLIEDTVIHGGLPRLRRVRVPKNFGWDSDAEQRQNTNDLSAMLQALAREDDGATGVPADKAGVWTWKGHPRGKRRREA